MTRSKAAVDDVIGDVGDLREVEIEHAHEVNISDAANAELEEIIRAKGAKDESAISPHDVLEVARNPASALHHKFCWDDGEAAEKYRLMQAGIILRKWKGMIIRVDEQKRVVNFKFERRVQSPGSCRGKGAASYQPVEEILSNPTKRADLVATVLKELLAIEKRYNSITELAEVWDAIGRAARQGG